MGESKVNLGAGSPRFKIDNDSYGTVFFDPDNPQYGPAFGPTASEVKDPEDALEAVPYEYPVSPSFRREGSPKISFGIGGYQVTPRVFFEGSQTGRTPAVSLPEGDVLYDQQNFNVSGKLGADVQTPGGDTLGASAAGYAYRGGIEFPDAMKNYGAEDLTYNSRGVEPSEYRGYYQMKDGPRAEGFYRPSADPTRDGEYAGRVSYTTSFEDGGEVEGESKVNLGAGAYLLNQDPSYDYPMNPLLPFASRNTMDVDQLSTDYMEGDTKLIVPPILADMFNASVRGGQMLQNEAPVTSKGIAGVALDTLPGSALVSRVTQDAAMAGPGAVLGINAFHGGPNRFLPEPNFPQGRPRLDKAGTGEGGQAQGIGFYSGQNQKTGEFYRDSVPPRLLKEADEESVSFDVASFGGDPEDLAEHASSRADRSYLRSEHIDHVFEDGSFYRIPHGELEGRAYAAPETHLYKLDIPDKAVAKFIDFDGSVVSQPDIVKNAFSELGYMPNNPENLAGGDIWYKIRQDLGEQAAADTMKSLGVPGIRYKDQFSRGRPDVDPTRNFVVWDQEVLDRTKLLQRNDEKIYAEGGPVSAGLGSLPASENILTSGTVSMSPSKYPNVDPRTAALGSQLLKRAKIPGKFPDMLNNADPDVIRQINRIMPRPEGKRLQSPTEGISLLMQSVVKTS